MQIFRIIIKNKYFILYYYNKKLCDFKYLRVFNYPNKYKIRLGNKGDGGYVIALVPGKYDFYISAGVSNEESFSRDFIKFYRMRKYNSYAFDGTINDYPYEYTKDITYIKKNINSFTDENNTNLKNFIDNFKNIFLKIDIEGSEFTWLASLTENDLMSFKQIVIEIHNIHDEHSDMNKYNWKIEGLKKLANTHYIVHAHANNYGPVVEIIPVVLELTYVRKNVFDWELSLNTNKLPDNLLDSPCNPGEPDIDLNFAPFVN